MRLNADRLGSDVRLFADALRRGDREGALGEYRGPFLDGFFVAGAADF